MLWLDNSPRKIHKWKAIAWKDAEHHQTLGKYKWKEQCITCTHPLEWLKFKHDWRYTYGWRWLPPGMSPAETQAILENRMAVLIKFNTYLAYDSAILSYAPRQIKIYVHIKTCLLTFTAALFIIAPPKKPTNLATTQLSISERMKKQIMG